MTRFSFNRLHANTVLAIIVAAAGSMQVARGQTTSIYAVDNDSNLTNNVWHSVSSWTNGIIPNAIDANAVFNQPVSNSATTGQNFQISLGGMNTTIGSLTSNNAMDEAHGFRTQIQNGKLIFQTSSGPATLNENLGLATTSDGLVE